MTFRYFFGFILLSILFIQCADKTKLKKSVQPYAIHQVDTSYHGMVVSAHPLATQVGVDILKQGGNAIDAAIAVQFALAVVYPRAGNLGGGGFMVARDKHGNNYALDYREKAPLAATKNMYLDDNGDIIKGLSLDGHMASGVPGTVSGMFAAFDSLSTLKNWKKLIQPSIDLAKNGVLLTINEAERLTKYHSDFKKYNDNSAFVEQENWHAGDSFKQVNLSQTLTRIADSGPAGFYEGLTAQLIVNEMKKGGGLISLKDLKSYSPAWRIPITGDYKGHQIISMPPASSGGIALVQLLEMLESFDFKKHPLHSVAMVHAVAEAERRVYADRAEHLGDTDHYPVPIKKLLDTNYIDQRYNDFDKTKATTSESILAGNFKLSMESFETTHTSVVDKNGMAVSITTTLNLNYGSKVVVHDAGFFLNNEMDDFSSKPGTPNYFGLVGSVANEIQPTKRMLSSMTPTIVTKNDSVYLVLGTPGGSTIITSNLQLILNVLEYDMTLEAASNAFRFHHQWLPDAIFIEKNGFPKATLDSLKAMGHSIEEYDRIGLEKAIIKKGNQLIGVGDRRGEDHAGGY